MKKSFIFTAFAAAIFMLTTISTFSQETAKDNELSFAETDALNTATPSADASVTANEKVQKSFVRHFAGASEQNWSMVGNDFHNNFYINGVLTRALFDVKGHLIYTITYGTEKDIPANVKDMVTGEYPNYAISMAINVKEGGRDIWVVKLDNNEQQLTIRVEYNETEQVMQFQKSK